MTQRLDRVEYKNGNQKRDCQMQVEDFRVFPEEVISRAGIDTFGAGFDAGYDTGVQDAFTDARVCAGCGRIAFKTKLGYCGECFAGIVEVALRYVLPLLVIGLITWLTS